MITIKINGKDHLININNRVITILYREKGKDALSGDSLEWLDNFEITEFIGHLGYLEGCAFKGVPPELDSKQFSSGLTRVGALEISGYFMREIIEAAEFVNTNFNSKKKQMPRD